MLREKYRRLFVLGRGGMGTVEAALEVGAGGYERVVALKRLLPDAVRDKRRADMFLREARVAALLEHPNVVRAYDYGEIEGELYLAMEYVEGQPLSRVLRALADAGERLPAPLAAFVLAEACEGLHAAHELHEDGQPLNLVHRDVSPQNVMIGYDGRVRLLDFGVAKIENENVTKTGEVKGKAAYMSPEQAMGEPLDRRSDLFGVGAILFECLELKRMWGDGTDMEVIRKLALEEPPPIADAPPELRDLYTKLVARDPKGRPATARDAADALRKIASGTNDDLRVLLERHFGAHAKEQRDKLARSLREVAPDKAEALRESVAPVSETRREEKKKSKAPFLIAGGLLVAGIAVWKLSQEPVNAPEPAPVRANVTAPVRATPTTPPPALSDSAPPVVASSVPVVVAKPPPSPRLSAPPPGTSTVTGAGAGSFTVPPKPVPTKPLDVDPTPF